MNVETQSPITFTITPDFEKGKKRLNTAEVIAEKLNKCTVSLGKTKQGTPSIFVKFENAKEAVWIASLEAMQDWDSSQYREYTADSGREWRRCFAKNPFRNGYEFYLFDHLTDSAEELVIAFMEACIEEFDKEIGADSQKLNVSVKFSPIVTVA